MMIKTKIIATFSALIASKNAVAASATTALTAAAISQDWILWAVSGAGAVAYRLKTPEPKKAVTIANGMISVLLGGLGAPWCMIVIIPGVTEPPLYLSAFLVALLWPYAWDKYIPSKKDGS